MEAFFQPQTFLLLGNGAHDCLTVRLNIQQTY